jgi:HEAT repeat protein
VSTAAGSQREPARLIDQLATASWSDRRALVVALAEQGEAAIPALIDALRGQRDDEARIAALVDALASSTGAVEAALTPHAGAADAALVADVAQVLGRRRSVQALPTLVGLLAHDDDNVAVSAIEALGRIGGPRAVEALLACLESGSFFRVFPAIDVLGRTGDPRAIEPLARLLSNPRYMFEAARALGRSADRAAVAPLLGLLNTPSEASLRVAALALSELAERHEERYGDSQPILAPLREARSERLVRRLGQALGGADKSEKLAICRVLGALQSGLAAPFLLAQLEGDAELQRTASASLKQIGKDSDRAISEALRDSNSARRAALLPVLAHLEHEAAVLACLEDPEPTVRALAADALARMNSRNATRALFALLHDEHARVVHAASAAISALGGSETEAYALRAAASAAPELRRAGLRILGYFGYASAFEPFRSALYESDARLRDAAAAGLAIMDEPRARPLLREAAAHADAKLRASATRALGHAEGSQETLDQLRRGLDDADSWVRYYAAQALGRLRAEDMVGPVSALLSDAAGHVRVAAVEALAHMPGELALVSLRDCARSADPDIRRAALLGLGMRGDESSLASFLEAARSDDAATRMVALSALASSTDPASGAALARAARDPDEAVRIAAVGYLAAAPGGDASAALIELVHEGKERTRALAALSTPHPERASALLVGLAGADDELAPLLSASLARLGGQLALDALVAALSLDNRSARMAAANALAAVGSREAYAALGVAAAHDPDPEVRRVCALHLTS